MNEQPKATMETTHAIAPTLLTERERAAIDRINSVLNADGPDPDAPGAWDDCGEVDVPLLLDAVHRLNKLALGVAPAGWLPIYPGCKLPELNAEWGNWVVLLNNYGESAQQPRFGRLCGDDEGGLFWHLDNQEAWAFENFTHYYPLGARPSAYETVNRRTLAQANQKEKGGHHAA